MLLESEGEEAITDHGDYVVIWKRQANREWLMQVDIFNSNVPLAQQVRRVT